MNKSYSPKIDIENPIYKYRVENNLSRKYFVENIGVSRKTMYDWETGNCVPSEENIKKLASLGIDESFIRNYYNNLQINKINKKASSLDKLKENPILKWRLQKGLLSREDLAKKLGVSRQTILNWETGINLPQEENLYRLANLMRKAALSLHEELFAWKESLQ